MEVRVVVEYNENGTLIYADNFPGAYTRGKNIEEALKKVPEEITRYLVWLEQIKVSKEDISVIIVQEQKSDLNICDADSDILFNTEREKLSWKEYERLKRLAIKSAEDFQKLYDSIPNKTATSLKPRKTFYGMIPLTAEEMYIHTKNVNNYYFREIHIDAVNEPDIVTCRKMAFDELEKQEDFLENKVYLGSYDEEWSLRKVCRRFVWHDRIHAKAMYKMAGKLCGFHNIENPFVFKVG